MGSFSSSIDGVESVESGSVVDWRNEGSERNVGLEGNIVGHYVHFRGEFEEEFFEWVVAQPESNFNHESSPSSNRFVNGSSVDVGVARLVIYFLFEPKDWLKALFQIVACNQSEITSFFAQSFCVPHFDVFRFEDVVGIKSDGDGCAGGVGFHH